MKDFCNFVYVMIVHAIHNSALGSNGASGMAGSQLYCKLHQNANSQFQVFVSPLSDILPIVGGLTVLCLHKRILKTGWLRMV